ncbi:MAG: flagellar biosynthetic protein FliR [Planctomycetaceae bacterium]
MDLLSQHIIAFMMVLTRVAAFVVVMPIFKREMVPKSVKLGLIFALTLLWCNNYAVPVKSYNVATLTVMAIREGFLGAAIGFVLGLFLFPVQVAGSWISQELGLSMASLADPVTQQNSTVVSQVFMGVGTLLFLVMNLHHSLFIALGMTFERIEFGAQIDRERFGMIAVDTLATGHETGLTIAGPVGVLLFLGSVVLFMLNRASPQLNLFSIGLPLRLAGGFTALLILMPETCLLIGRSLTGMVERLYSVL